MKEKTFFKIQYFTLTHRQKIWVNNVSLPDALYTDLTSAYYQLPLAKESQKYCGVATPYWDVRVYTRTDMGMPGSETALRELMCRILGDRLKEGIIARLADDLYSGDDTPQELLENVQK